MTLIGVDIGGSHISVAQVFWDGREAQFGDTYEDDVDTFRSAEEIILDWADVIRKAVKTQTNIKIGIAMPGPFDYLEGISLIKDQGKMKSLFGLSVKELLSRSLNLNPDNIAFSNDAEAFLLGESLAGAGRRFENSIGLTLGTGLGSAIKIGEIVKDAKLWTAPFRDGIAEDFLGTIWFKNYALEKYGIKISGVKDLLLTDFDRAHADQIFAEFGKSLGEFLSLYVKKFQCQGVVLGGKITRASDRFLPHTQSYLKNFNCSTEITISELGEKAALIGSCIQFLNNTST